MIMMMNMIGSSESFQKKTEAARWIELYKTNLCKDKFSTKKI